MPEGSDGLGPIYRLNARPRVVDHNDVARRYGYGRRGYGWGGYSGGYSYGCNPYLGPLNPLFCL